MCEAKDRVHGRIRCGDYDYGEGDYVGTEHLEVGFDKNGNVVAAAPFGFTESEVENMAEAGIYPGSLLESPVYVTDIGKVVHGPWATLEESKKEGAQKGK